MMEKYIEPKTPLKRNPIEERYDTYIEYGDQLREHFEDAAILSKLTIKRVVRRRTRISYKENEETYSRTVYLIHQFKRKEEVDVFRSIYGRLFFQVSIYSRKGSRVDALSRKIASSNNVSGPDKFRSIAERLVNNDENEVTKQYGQRVAKIFHDADVIISLDSSISLDNQIKRFGELIFGSNGISPTRVEYGMFLAKAAALRTLDLSHQVGAAIFSKSGEIISLGSNEVPKAGGGTYWEGGDFDDREFRRGIDSNDKRKREIFSEIAKSINPSLSDVEIDKLAKIKEIQDSQLMDALEYGRIVHAEMSAITDAARRGTSTLESTLYCTTFPCHMCAKHIVASGVTEVVFLEPYPKSLAFDLHSDSLDVEGRDRGLYRTYPNVSFTHFFGISPRRYREIFERTSRKNSDGSFRSYINDFPSPFIDIKFPFYVELENYIIETTGTQFANKEFDGHIDSIDDGNTD